MAFCLSHVVAWSPVVLILIPAVGVGTCMEELGVLTEPGVAPMLRAAGYSPMVSAIPWPKELVEAVRGVKHVMGLVSGSTLFGVPLDLPVRLVFFCGVHYLLRRRLSFRASAAGCVAFLLGTELFELIAVRNPLHPASPDFGDVLDVASGIAGILAGEFLRRWRTRGALVVPEDAALRDVAHLGVRLPTSGQGPADQADK